MNFPNVLIVTYGRTGSTLLMGVLNSIPGVLVSGENMNFCAGLFEAHEALVETKTKHGNNISDPTLPFFGAENFDERRFLEDARSLLRHQLVPEELNGVVCWGFKEIRYTPNALRKAGRYELAKYLNFLSKLLPGVAFIFLTRNHEDVAESAFWQISERSSVVAGMKAFERNAKNWSEKRADSYWIDYSNLVGRDEKLVKLFEFLGAAYDPERVQKVMSREHSYAGKPENLAGAVRRNSGSAGRKIQDIVPASRNPQGSAVKIVPLELVEKISVEYPKAGVKSLKSVVIRGVVVLKSDAVGVWKLLLQTTTGDCDVNWGLPSPRVALEYPGNPNAQLARFTTSLPLPQSEQGAKLCLVDSKNVRHCLATINP